MAHIEVTGEVIRHLGEKGFTLAEPIIRKGDAGFETIGKNYYTVWFAELPPLKTSVFVTGRLSVKLDEYQGKPQVKTVINAKTVTVKTMDKSDFDSKKPAPTAPDTVPSVDEPLPF